MSPTISVHWPRRPLLPDLTHSAGRLVLVAGVAGLLGLALLGRNGAGYGDEASSGLQALAVGTFLAAGVLCISRWQITADSRSGLLGAALVVLGAGTVARSFLDPTAVPGTGVGFQAEVATAITVAIVLIVVVGSLTADEQDQRLRPLVVLAAGLLAAAVGCAAVALANRMSVALFEATPTSLMLLDLVVAVLWASAAVLAWARRAGRPWATRLAVLLAGMGAAEVLRAVAVRDGGTLLGVNLLIAAVAATGAGLALLELIRAVGVEHEELAWTSAQLSLAKVSVTERDDWREELSHDAVNSLAGLRAALTTLERYDDRLDEDTVRRLRSAALEEVKHLEHLVQRTADEQSVPLAVGEVIRSVVATRRAHGLEVQLGPVDSLALGCAGDLATVLHNLLVNAERHAPGSRVEVTVARATNRVEITVADDGPGVADDVVQRVFERGARGPASAGSGLGLHVARQLMRAQGGGLELRRHTGGCVFVASLLAAEVPTQQPVTGVAIPRQRRPADLAVVPDAHDAPAAR